MLLLKRCNSLENRELFEIAGRRKLMNVMVVDDNPQTRHALIAFISLCKNIQICAEASNGQEAIGLLRDHVPDVILMDAHMPVMDGLEATRIMKKTWPQIKIVFLTMYAHYEPEAIIAGADAFLRKDCRTALIVSTLERLFHQDDTGKINLEPLMES